MRKLSAKQRLYQIRVAAKRFRRQLASKERRRQELQLNNLSRDELRAKGFRGSLALEVFAPRSFGITEARPRKAVLKFLHELAYNVLRLKREVRINFRRTERMFANGTLLFAATLDRLNRATNGKMITCDLPRNRLVEQVLQHVGILRMLHRTSNRPITAENVRFWRVQSARDVDAQRAEELCTEWRSVFSEAASQDIYKALSEAMTNCVQHAYCGQSNEGWWMFWERREGNLCVVLCDLGIGIPRSLCAKDGEAKNSIRRLIRRGTTYTAGGFRGHGAYIAAAMALGRSRTQQAHRGKGLTQLKSGVSALGGTLRVLSSKGMFVFNAEDEREWTVNFADSIGGTLISWNVPLEKGVEK